MRRHGWELPYHPLQIVAIAVLLALAFAFYVFFVPFVGNATLRLLGICVYSPLMTAVFSLYMWCAATNPADPAVLRSKKCSGSSTARTSTSWETSRQTAEKNDTSTEPSSVAHASSESDSICERRCNMNWVPACGVRLCSSQTEASQSEDEMLYCSLCEVEISKCSKHCRVCDKCIDCFDHHCRWLNNCIGRKNYKIFIMLMVSAMALLILQWVVGVWVIARCFVNRSHFQEDITTRLGSSFSVVPFLCVVVFCTVLAVVATLPLGQLCFFHALLIQKGISTYDYIVAMRERDQLNGAIESAHSPYASPASSVATAISGVSSAGTLQHGAWCTAPHLFLDHEQAPFQPERKSTGVEAGKKPVTEEIVPKVPVKISPWALARLDTKDVVRAASEARRNSSILRPVVQTRKPVVIAETDSSSESGEGNACGVVPISSSVEKVVRASNDLSVMPPKSLSAVPWHGKNVVFEQVLFGGNSRGFINGSGSAASTLIPLQVEARNAFCANDATRQCSSSSTESSVPSPDGGFSGEFPFGQEIAHYAASSGEEQKSTIIGFRRSASDGYEASGGESADDNDRYLGDHPWMNLKAQRDASIDRNKIAQFPTAFRRAPGRFYLNKYQSSRMVDSSPDKTGEIGEAIRQLALVTNKSNNAEHAIQACQDDV